MTGKDLFREVGNINEKYITEAEETKKSIIHNVAFRRGIGTAACLVLCVGIFAITRIGNKSADMAADYAPNYDSASEAPEHMSDGTNHVEMNAAEQEMEDVGYSSGWEEVFDSERAESSAGVESDTPSNTPEEVVGDEPSFSDSEIVEYDDEWIMERLQAYPNDYEQLLETDAFVVVHGTVKSGMEQWEVFWNSVNEGKPAYVDVIRFTEEGDAIITSIQFTGAYFRTLEDHTRDAWANPNYSFMDYGCMNLYLDIQEDVTRVLLSELRLEKEEIADALVRKPGEFNELFQYTNN